jgi:hypothetical protein
MLVKNSGKMVIRSKRIVFRGRTHPLARKSHRRAGTNAPWLHLIVSCAAARASLCVRWQRHMLLL